MLCPGHQSLCLSLQPLSQVTFFLVLIKTRLCFSYPSTFSRNTSTNKPFNFCPLLNDTIINSFLIDYQNKYKFAYESHFLTIVCRSLFSGRGHTASQESTEMRQARRPPAGRSEKLANYPPVIGQGSWGKRWEQE